MKKFAMAAILATSSFLSAHAASITGLVNTGSFASGAQDTNYTLNGGSFGYVTSNGSFPLKGDWIANTATSKWITPLADQAADFDPVTKGTYTWSLSFNLTGFDAATASFSGKFAADNSAVAFLNGHSIGSANGFKSFSNFGATSGFNSGLNTLDFVVTNVAQNSGNPTGLRVEFTASNVTPVPEPETYAMLLAGLGLMGVISRRRAKRNAA